MLPASRIAYGRSTTSAAQYCCSGGALARSCNVICPWHCTRIRAILSSICLFGLLGIIGYSWIYSTAHMLIFRRAAGAGASAWGTAANRPTVYNAAAANSARTTRSSSAMGARHRWQLAVCAIVRDEARYVGEWMEFHLGVGVDQFVIYDDNSTDGLSAVLAPYVDAGLAQLIAWPTPTWPDDRIFKQNPCTASGRHSARQLGAITHCIAALKHRAKWVALIDPDEFLVPVTQPKSSLVQVLAREDFGNLDALVLPNDVFGSAGHMERPAMLVLDAYRMRAERNFERVPASAGYDKHLYQHQATKLKSIVNPRRVVPCGCGIHILSRSSTILDESLPAPTTPLRRRDLLPAGALADGTALDRTSFTNMASVGCSLGFLTSVHNRSAQAIESLYRLSPVQLRHYKMKSREDWLWRQTKDVAMGSTAVKQKFVVEKYVDLNHVTDFEPDVLDLEGVRSRLRSRRGAQRSIDLLVLGMHRPHTSIAVMLMRLFQLNYGHASELVTGCAAEHCDASSIHDNFPDRSANHMWENQHFVALNEALMQCQFGVTMLDMSNRPEVLVAALQARESASAPGGDLPDSCAWCKNCNRPTGKSLQHQMRQLHKRVRAYGEAAAMSVTVWKDARLAFTLPVWRASLGADPVVVHVLCHPLHAAQTLQRREGLRIECGLAVWHAYTWLALHHARGLCQVVLSADALARQPVQTMQRLMHNLADRCAVTDTIWPPPEEMRLAVNWSRFAEDSTYPASAAHAQVLHDHHQLYEDLVSEAVLADNYHLPEVPSAVHDLLADPSCAPGRA